MASNDIVTGFLIIMDKWKLRLFCGYGYLIPITDRLGWQLIEQVNQMHLINFAI